ncbi:hypothetical protein V6N11_052197 [Hibiscus sabdariffa]|uniref:Sugar phosphate transporter domain-containing protein n=1 Tax=Hibiscus sabdariffa TaxID=183260 RepID=A0ABR2U9A5_9ROSI
MSLDEISPLTFSIGNTMKRISVIVSSIIIFHTPVQPINALGAAIAVLNVLVFPANHNIGTIGHSSSKSASACGISNAGIMPSGRDNRLYEPTVTVTNSSISYKLSEM